MRTCDFEGCSRKHWARGLCKTHYRQINEYGLEPRPIQKRAKRGSNGIKYQSAHNRVRYKYGYASKHKCLICGEQAREWAYNHKALDEKHEWRNGHLLPYSTNPDDYMPLCAKCHRNYDKEHSHS